MQQSLKRKLITAVWLSVTIAGMVLLGAAASKKSTKLCKGIVVEIEGGDDHFFVDENEVMQLLNANGSLSQRPVESINLLMLEKRLENNRWIRNAELYIDNKQIVQVRVEENEPVARVFTRGGYQYYIDSSCNKLPLSNRLSARVPMITNFPSDRTRWSRLDSNLMASLKEMALYINKVPFWKAQVAQLNVNDNREIEMFATIGNHVVLLGKPEQSEEKFNRLFSFYKQVWAKVGLEKYETIDVRFTGQVVAVKKGAAAAALAIDSVKAKQAVDNMLQAEKSSDIATIVQSGAANSTTTQVRTSDAMDVKKTGSKMLGAPKAVNTKSGKVPKAIMKQKDAST